MALLMCFCYNSVKAGDSQSHNNVHAFYYPWYGNPQTDNSYYHWNHQQSVKEGKPRSYPGGNDIGANFYPKLGCYSSNSDHDLDAHMLMLRQAKVGVICSSWWGKDSYTDKALPRLLDAAARYNIKVCFHIEPFPGRNAQTTRDAIVYIIDKYGSHQAFYCYGDDKPRPMFYVYDSYLTSAEQWKTILAPDGSQTIRNTKYDSVVIGLWVKEHEQAFMTEGHFDGYYTYFATDGFTYGSTIKNWPRLAELAKQNGKIFIPSVGPGYVDLRIRPWNDVNTRERRNGAYYDQEFTAAIAVHPPVLNITSFNEWHEGTQIEPAVLKEIPDFKYLDYSPHEPEYYLDRTSYWVDRYCEHTNAQSTKYMIIVTGNELLSGIYPDGHTYFITNTLRPLGLECIGSMIVDDERTDIEEALRYATNKAKLVIITGGLGPTDNDITRQTLSDFTGIELKEQPDILRQMEQRFHTPLDKLRANLRRQTEVPEDGTYFRNTEGTAVGLVFNSTSSVIVALPGPPRELQPMVINELVPYLSRRFGTRLPGCSLTLRFIGLGQSQIDQTLKDNVPLAPDITVSSQFKGGRVDFTFSLPEDTPQYRARLQELEQKIMKHLGRYIYADDETSLEENVLELLRARNETLALAEVGSGGTLAAAFSNADANGQVLVGAFVAPNLEKLYRLLKIDNDASTKSTSTDKKLNRIALTVANATASQWVIVVGPAHRDENGNGYVEVVFKMPDGHTQSQDVRLRGNAELARSRLSTQLLDQLRRRLK